MNKNEIINRSEELDKQIDSLFQEKAKLDEMIDNYYDVGFLEFIRGKKFKVNISDDLERLYLTNTEFKISDFEEFGVDYHKTFHIVDNVHISVDDGDINISSTKFKKLLDWCKEMEFVLDLSNIQEKMENLQVIINKLGKIK